jgi:hypothetical protein
VKHLQIAEKELRCFRTDILGDNHTPLPHEVCALAHVRMALTHIAMADLCMGVTGGLPLPHMVFNKLVEREQ